MVWVDHPWGCQGQLTEDEPLLARRSTQGAALAHAAHLGRGSRVNSYTFDICYAFGACHAAGMLWKEQGFFTSAEYLMEKKYAVCQKLYNSLQKLLECLAQPTLEALQGPS